MHGLYTESYTHINFLSSHSVCCVLCFLCALCAGPAGAPRNITLLSNASTFIELSYVQPDDDGNSNNIGYRVMCSTNFGDASREGHVVAANVSDLTANITGLYAGETYTCTVQARNVAGYGASASRSQIELLPGGKFLPRFLYIRIGYSILDC